MQEPEEGRGWSILQKKNGLLTKIGCFRKRRALVSAGPGSDSASPSSRISSKRLPALLFHPIPSSTQRDISTGLLQRDLSRNSKACHTEKLKRGVLSAEILVEV